MKTRFLGVGESGYHPLRKVRVALNGLRFALGDFSVAYKMALLAVNLIASAWLRHWVDVVVLVVTGQVLTAAHVVQTVDRIEVQFMTGEPIPVRVISAAPFADVALLQLDHVPATAVAAELGDSDLSDVVDQVLVVGAPCGMALSMRVGYINAHHRLRKVYDNLASLELLQTVAAIFEGNSGGPVCNLSGQVIGIVTHVLSKPSQSAGPGMAVASNAARRLLIESRRFPAPVRGRRLAGRKDGFHEGTLRILIGEQTFLAGGDFVLEMAVCASRATPSRWASCNGRLMACSPASS